MFEQFEIVALHAERAHPGAHEQVAARPSSTSTGDDGLYGVFSVNRCGIVELEVAVHLVGGDVVEPRAVPARRLEQRVGADDVRVEERPRVVQRVVVVRLGGVVHDGVGVGEQLVDERGIRDVALDEARRGPSGSPSSEARLPA